MFSDPGDATVEANSTPPLDIFPEKEESFSTSGRKAVALDSPPKSTLTNFRNKDSTPSRPTKNWAMPPISATTAWEPKCFTIWECEKSAF